MKVSIIGQGYVGLTISVGAASAGHEVVGFDIDDKLIQNLQNGNSFVPGIKKKELLNLQNLSKLNFASDPKAFSQSEIVVIAVPTPLTEARDPDLNFLTSASILVAKNIRTNSLIINESTSYPGTLRNLIKPIFESYGKYVFEFGSAPERVDPGNPQWNLDNTPRVVSGLTNSTSEKVANFYRSFCSKVKIVSSPEVAEASKLFENTFRQVNIALVNEFAQISRVLNFSSQEAIAAASTKPFGFMPFYPSIGVGGHCIPVDPIYLSFAADKKGTTTQFINLANQVNLGMISYIIDRMKEQTNGSLDSLKIQLAGISYKNNIPDLRESPALGLMSELKRQGAHVSWFDPLVDLDFPGRCQNLDKNIDLGLIITPHDVIDFSVWKVAKIRVLDLSANSNDYGWPKFL